MTDLPIIRLEVERMQFGIYKALTEHAAQMDTSIRQAVEAYCTPENIDAVVKKSATEALDAAVKEEVRSFFGNNGAGRKAVRVAVINWLNDVYPDTDEQGIMK